MRLSNTYICLTLCILLLFLLTKYQAIQNKNNIHPELERYENLNEIKKNTQIIKTICQTYGDKKKIPEKVYQNIKKFLPDFKHQIFDDADCLKFLSKFDKKYSKTLFNNKSTVENFKIQKVKAHKADLFRYCYLYENGGLYADIKTCFIKPISELQLKNNLFYSAIDLSRKAIYQGVIYSPPKNKIFIDNIKFILDNPNPSYAYYIRHLYNNLKKHSINNNIKAGLNKMKDIPNVYLYMENSYVKKYCENKLDRYGLCTFITDKGEKLIRTRYSDYPW